MTEIMVSKRDGIVRAPDGTQFRVARGKTLADARHPVVEAFPGDWMPMTIDLAVDGDGTVPSHAEQLAAENELAEAEQLAEHRGRELVRLLTALEERGLVPAGIDRNRAGWLVDLAIEQLGDAKTPQAEPPVSPPRVVKPPRKATAPKPPSS